MPRPVIGHKEKDDIQEDVFQLLAQLIFICIENINNKDVYSFYDNIDNIFLLTHMRLKKKDFIEQELDEIRTILHNEYKTTDEVELSSVFIRLRRLFMLLTEHLDEINLLYKMRDNFSEMSIR